MTDHWAKYGAFSLINQGLRVNKAAPSTSDVAGKTGAIQVC